MSEYTPTTDAVRQAYAQRYVEQVEYTTVGYSEFDRWLAAHDAEVRSGVVAEEPEWEYGTRRPVTDGWESGDRYGEHEYIDARSISDNINEDRSTTLPRRDMTRAVRRRKAGEWVPVEN